MGVNGVGLEKAIAAVRNGMDIVQAAKEFRVEVQAIANALNPNGGGKPEDSFKKERIFNEVYTNSDGSKVRVAKLSTRTLSSGRKIETFIDTEGKKYYQYRAADGTVLKESYFNKVERSEYEDRNLTLMQKFRNYLCRKFPAIGFHIDKAAPLVPKDVSIDQIEEETAAYIMEHPELLEKLTGE